jgi:hypothetical protein
VAHRLRPLTATGRGVRTARRVPAGR